ncbi:MAG: tripartite tricarboxylate transporter TctB family protein [Clostridia bacterium]|nr:tripartite tricarboxylate transporter TctB family protein [Clostridia bacterium]
MEAFGKWLGGLHFMWFIAAGLLIMAVLFVIFRSNAKTRPKMGQLLTLSGMCVMTLFFYLLTWSLRVSKMAQESGCTARTIPRLWCVLMVPAALGAFFAILKEDNKPDKPYGQWTLALGVAAGAIFSVVLFQYVGYYISSALFIFAVMWVMEERNWKMLIGTPVCWVVFTYFVFDQFLYISLPIGALFEMLL